MHLSAWQFILGIFNKYPTILRLSRILDCGSMNVSKWTTGRDMFVFAKEYVGIDWRPGDNVDFVGLVHEYREKPDGYFQFVLSTEMLEHDPHWDKSLARMVDLLGPEGSMIVTTAGPERPPHRQNTAPESGYYGNRTAKDILSVIIGRAEFRRIQVEETKQDVYCFFGGKK